MSLKKNYNLLAILLLGSSLFFNSCNKSDSTVELIGDWARLSELDGTPRSEAVAFTIGTNGYVVAGYNNEKKERLNNMWMYNPDKDIWTQKAEMPALAKKRSAAVAFSIGTKGYVGTGYDDDGNKLKDFWAYDSTNDTWTSIASLPADASGRYSAVAFAVNGKGYVGTGVGEDGVLKDFYQYTPASDKWEILPFSGDRRKDACTFVIGTKAYLVSGSNSQSLSTDLWRFNSEDLTWTKMESITDADKDEKFDDEYTTIVRSGAVAFVINGKGYLATGNNTSAVSNVWEYNPTTDRWVEKTSFKAGATRSEAVAFGFDKYGYITTGRNSSVSLFDLVRFDPNAEDSTK